MTRPRRLLAACVALVAAMTAVPGSVVPGSSLPSAQAASRYLDDTFAVDVQNDVVYGTALAADGTPVSLVLDLYTPRGDVATEAQRRDIAALFGAEPPVALEAEMGLIGAIIWDPKVVGDVIAIVRNGEDFSSPRHGRIYDAIVEIYERHATVDIVLLNQLLTDRGLVDAVGGLGERPVLLVGRDRRRQEEHLVEAGLFAAAFRRDQMPLVHRVETAAIQADAHRSSFMEALINVRCPSIRASANSSKASPPGSRMMRAAGRSRRSSCPTGSTSRSIISCPSRSPARSSPAGGSACRSAVAIASGSPTAWPCGRGNCHSSR